MKISDAPPPRVEAPEIARLRRVADDDATGSILAHDLCYALARVDESCAGCMVIECVAQQARNIDRLYAMIDEIMAEKRAGG